MENMELFGKRLLVKKDAEEEKVVRGIIIPGLSDEKQPITGVVMHKSGGYHENGHPIELKVNVGDKVLFFRQAGIDIRIDSEDLFLIDEDKILARF